NVALSILLVYEYGAIGAAIGTFATTAVLAPVRFPLVCRTVGYPLPTFLRLSLGAAIASSLPALVAMGLVWTLLPSSALRLAAGIAVGLGLAAGVALVQIGPRRLARLIRAAREGPAPHWKEGGGELVSEVTGGAS
ncbi:MAG: polysaccharide biosynthesis C-terminal domain-containing protein, partial [Actinobacteria bacterium]|nr:polysaccharide biosynthesis C-terminal domain-containing protein [Actinomycetota bacterium]